MLQGKRVILRRSTTDLFDLPALPGTIVEADGDRLIVATGHGALRILEIQSEGKRPMHARDFLAGHRLSVGDRFDER